MLKKYAHKIIVVLIGIGFFLIPVADTRPFLNIPLYPLDYVSLAIILLSLFLWLGTDFQRRENKALKVCGLLGLFVTSVALSFFINTHTLTSLGQIKSWIVLPAIAGMFGALALQRHQERDKNIIQVVFFGALSLLVVVLLYAIFQNFTFDGRLQGPFTSPNFLAFFLFPGSLMSFYFWRKTEEKKKKGFFVLLALLFLYVLFLTHSFGGWLALGASATWYVWRMKLYKKYKKILLIVFCILLTFVTVEIASNEKLRNIFEARSSLASRITIWTVAIEAIKNQPLVGIGPGNFQAVYLSYQPYYPPFLEWAVPQPHNLFLALWLQAGLIGLLVILGLLYKILLTQENAEEYIILQSWLVGILAYGIFDTPLFGNALSFVWWTVLAFLLFPILKKRKTLRLTKGF